MTTQQDTEPTWGDIQPHLEQQIQDLDEASRKLTEALADRAE